MAALGKIWVLGIFFRAKNQERDWHSRQWSLLKDDDETTT
jgi:hypothetical protein